MKITLMYNYDIEKPTIYRVNRRIYIKSNKCRYMLLPIKSKKELNEIYTILKNHRLIDQYYKFVMTKNNSLTITHAGIDYTLIKIANQKFHMEERIIKEIPLPSAIYMLDRSNWHFLWSKKNDYMEYKNSCIKKKFKTIDESSDYYLGMAETAIAYLANSENLKNKNQLTLTHRRLTDEEISNPLNLIIDVKERDISEYLKYLFINQNHTLTRVKQILYKFSTEKISYSKIYARLLYPNYFFDLCDNIELGIEKEDKLQELIKRIDEYEIYLSDIYNIIISKEKIKKIDWL